METPEVLRSFKPAHSFFIGIDSDGCVFDSMEVKQKECFTPMFVKHFGLQAVSKYARQTWEFVNLYSKTRGCNRFLALSRTLKLLRARPEVVARGVKIPDDAALDEWIARQKTLDNKTLTAEVEGGNKGLAQILVWSKAVNAAVADIVEGVPPFPLVRECLEKMGTRADAMVISQTPTEALKREWAEHGIEGYVRVIAGQELGTKKEHLKLAAVGKYAARNILMIGDAPGDYQAAKANEALFYPIVPGREEASWRKLEEEGLERFFTGGFAGDYEAGLLREFEASLPENPPWESGA
jgi:phosphoglycolate phosphatase-like HAD superfamily hydrolase